MVKPGPRKQYGEREDIRLKLPVEIKRYIDTVALNRTRWLIEAAREKMEREQSSSQQGDPSCEQCHGKGCAQCNGSIYYQQEDTLERFRRDRSIDRAIEHGNFPV